MGAIARHLAALFVLLLAFWAAAAWLRRPLLRYALVVRLPLRLAAGAGVWSAIVFLLASVQLLRPGVLTAALVVVSGAGLWHEWAAKRAAAEPQSSASVTESGAQAHPGRLVLVAGLALVSLVLVLQALRPNVAWDAEVYHLTVPRLYLEHGGFYRVPWNVYANWPSAVQLLYAICLALDGPQLANLLHLSFALLAALLVAGLPEHRELRPRELLDHRGLTTTGLAAAALFLAHPVVLYEARIAYVDCAFALFLLAAFASLEHARDQPPGSPHVWLAGAFAGLAAATKLNGFMAPLALFAVYLLPRWRRHGAGDLLRFTLPAAALLAPWLAKSWWLTGNPVHPLLYSVFGGGEWSAQLGAQHAAWQGAIGMGREPFDYLLLPGRVLCCGGFGYQHFDGALHRASVVLVPLALLGLRGERRAQRAALVALAYFVLWAATSQQMRFLIPILPLLALVTATGLGRLAGILGRLAGTSGRPVSRLGRPALAGWALAALALALLLPASWVYTRQSPRLFGDLLRHGQGLDQMVVHPVYRFLAEQVPAPARVLLVNTNHTFRIRQTALADSFFEASQVADAFAAASTSEQAAATAAALGVSHVVLEHQDRGIRFAPGLIALLGDQQRVRLVYRSPDERFSVFALRQP